MGRSFINSAALLWLGAISRDVFWCYLVAGLVLAVGLAAVFARNSRQNVQGFDKLILCGPLFYAAPLAAFGTEHFTQTVGIASMVPSWIPWHLFFAYFVGACFIAAGLSLATRVQARLSGTLLALTFFLFVVLMDVPGWAQDPGNRFAPTLALRELCFSAGALALVASLSERSWERIARILATFSRYVFAVALLFYSWEQFLHSDHVPGIPLEMVTPPRIYGHNVWTYLIAVVYAIAGALLLIGKKKRAAAVWAGVSVFFVELVVYVPIAIMDRARLEGFNYLGDTLMFCGAVLMLAGAMPHERKQDNSLLDAQPYATAHSSSR